MSNWGSPWLFAGADFYEKHLRWGIDTPEQLVVLTYPNLR